MKYLPSLACVLLVSGLGIGTVMGTALPALADGSAWANTPTFPDPSLANGKVISPSAATGGTAVVSAAADGPLMNCSRRNPCAMPAPARDHVAVIAAGAATDVVRHTVVARSVVVPKSGSAGASELGGKPAS